MENKEEEKIEFEVKINRILFQQDTFKIVSFTVVNKNSPMYLTNITVKGSMPDLELGMKYKIIVKEIIDKKYGKQYQLISLRSDFDLSDGNESKKFFSFFLTGFQIDNLFKTFDNPLEILENKDIEALCKVKGISNYKAKKIITAYFNNKDNSMAYVKLYDYGLTKDAIDKLVLAYGSPEILVDKINTNPYILIDEIRGYGWKKADAIALNSGIAPTSKFRLTAFAKYYLDKCANDDGDTWIDLQELRDAYTEVIPEASDEQVREALQILTSSFGDVKPAVMFFPETNRVCLSRYYYLEENICKEINRILKAPNLYYDKDAVEPLRKEVEDIQGWTFEEEQVKAAQMALNNQVSIITGGAGSGKSSSLALATKILSYVNPYNIRQTALAGRAASRMSEITGLEGYTIHRLIGMSPENDNKPKFNETNPLLADVVILDETSMVDGMIFLKLLKAIPTGCKLIMLGDIYQLESIGLCNLLKDMISSGKIPCCRLEKIHRQAAKSGIITTALKAKNGEQIIPSITYEGHDIKGELQDLEIISITGNEATQDKILTEYRKLRNKGINKEDIDIIVPMRKRGNICLNVLNKKIQDIVANKAFESAIIRKDKETGTEVVVYENDRVIVTENCYNDVTNYENEDEEIAIFNGNIGKVVEIKVDSMVVDLYQVGKVVIPNYLYGCLDLGYAITCHAKQGSEVPYAIIGLDSSCYTLLSREWLYTALTRAKKHCILVGQNTALHRAVKISSISKKRTWLSEFLKQQIG